MIKSQNNCIKVEQKPQKNVEKSGENWPQTQNVEN